jgi:hypothetical protein
VVVEERVLKVSHAVEGVGLQGQGLGVEGIPEGLQDRVGVVQSIAANREIGDMLEVFF